MSTSAPKSISTNGLVFYFDQANSKCYRGEPTINYAYDQNPRIDSSYTLWTPNYGGLFDTRHSDAIRVYNDAGSELTNYVNTGVTDWTNTYHAIWTYDATLKRPVITMNDFDNQWKAKSWYVGINFNSLGMTVGSKYTISWLQWTNNLTKRVNAGLYTQNGAGTHNFWDGLSDGSATSTNTITNTWQRVYHTFTVTSNWNLSNSYTAIYMYGHVYTTGVVKIADVQFELKDHPTQFSKAQTRTAANSVSDITKNYSIDATYASYNTSASIAFNGSSGYLTTSAINLGNKFTICAWVRSTNVSGDMVIVGEDANGCDNWFAINGGYLFGFFTEIADVNNWSVTGGTALSNNVWYHATFVVNQTIATVYLNGKQDATTTVAFTIGSWTGAKSIGRRCPGLAQRYFNGNIDTVSMYNRVLSASEISMDFTRTKSKYGL